MRSVASVCLSVSVYICFLRAVTFGSLELETSFSVYNYTYILRILRSTSYTKVIGSKSRSQELIKGHMGVTKYTDSRVVHLE